MKIAVWHNLPSGGGKRALYSQVAQLLQRGHSVEVWCPETSDATYLPLSSLTTENRLPFRPSSCPPLSRWRRLQCLTHPQPDPLGDEMDRHSAACAEAIKCGDFDLVFTAPCLFYRVPRIGAFLKEAGLPVLLYLQEPRRWAYEALPELPWIAPCERELPKNRLRINYWRFLFGDYNRLTEMRVAARRELEDAKAYTKILVNSLYSRESTARAYGLNSSVSYLGYDADVFRHRRAAREDFVVGLGSMDYIKGVDTAIEAMASLPPALRIPLVWIANSGDRSYEAEMIALAKERGVIFEIKQRVTDNELGDLLNKCRLLLYTSRLEPFGFAPVEANACGAPVVAVAEGGVRETIYDGVNGLLCERDANEVAAAVAQVLSDRNLAAMLGDAGARLALEKWSLDDATERLLAHFEVAVANSQAKDGMTVSGFDRGDRAPTNPLRLESGRWEDVSAK
jgi:glycosyltransferase involved in cell wall biosynthesis